MSEYKICCCDLSGEYHVISKKDHCELCNFDTVHNDFTPKNVNSTFRYIYKQLDRIERIAKEGK